MIIGDPSTFAIESGITQAFERLSFRALGYFVLHIGGRCYGVRKADATMLACSFDEVQRRIAHRGSHTAPFASEPADAGRIADAIRDARYASDKENRQFFGIPQNEFRRLLNSNHFEWAPDGDEAFDDGSHVLHFDVKDCVRLIAFKWSSQEDHHHDPNTLSDVWLETDKFYSILKLWLDAFESEWSTIPKTSKSEDGAESN